MKKFASVAARSLSAGLHRVKYNSYGGASSSMMLFPAVGLVALCSLTNDAYCDAPVVTVDNNTTLSATSSTAAAVSVKYPIYRKAELAKHDNPKAGYWVSYKDGIYDITKFIVNHPGGMDKIKLAAGKSVEPFWQLYRQHYNTAAPLEILATMRIGTLHPEDVASNEKTKDTSDPYKDDPEASPVMRMLQQKPLCAESPDTLLTNSHITPTDLFFKRNHHPIPHVDADKYVLTITNTCNCSEDASSDAISNKRYTLQDLKTKFKKHSVISTIECGGNRRAHLNVVKKTAGLAWSNDAIGTAKWSGVRMADIIADATRGVGEGGKGLSLAVLEQVHAKHSENSENSVDSETRFPRHVQFESVDGVRASIPIRKALDYFGDAILAYEMNDEPLRPEHGFPVRAIAPGHVGIRNVKWVNRLVVHHEESTGAWQRGMAYKGFGPNIKSLEGFTEEQIAAVQSVQEMPVNSVITVPEEGQTLVHDGYGLIKGYAYSGGGKGIIRVDVSLDGGNTWAQAQLREGAKQPIDRAWAWTLWEYELPQAVLMTPSMPLKIICKATDSSYNCQPESTKDIWNIRGIINNAWHQVNVIAEQAPEEVEEEEGVENSDDRPSLAME